MNRRNAAEQELQDKILAMTNNGKDYFTYTLPNLEPVSDTIMVGNWNPLTKRDETIQVELFSNYWAFCSFKNGRIDRALNVFSFCGCLNGLDPIEDFNEICTTIDKELDLGLFAVSKRIGKSDESDKSDVIPRIFLQGEFLPVIPKTIYRNLPPFLKSLTDLFETQQDKDLLLLSTLTVFSGCFPKLYGIYARKEIHLNIYLMISAKASAGKSIAKWGRVLLKRVEDDYKKRNKMLFFPVDVSFAALIEELALNDGKGIMFATEADSLTQNFSKEWGNTTSLLRHAYEHETYDNMRKGENRKRAVNILNKPALSILLTGTPNQIGSLIPDTEDGLFSRFCFYQIDLDTTWKSVFPNGDEGYESRAIDELLVPFQETAESIYNAMNQAEINRIRFKLSKEQEMRLDAHFSKMSLRYKGHSDINAIATIRRQGVVTFRIAGILTAIRSSTEPIADLLICSDDDFNTALAISDVFSQHAFSIARNLIKPVRRQFFIKKTKLLEELPNEFNRKEADEIGNRLGIKENTVEKYLNDFIPEYLDRIEYNSYRKVRQASEASDLSDI